MKKIVILMLFLVLSGVFMLNVKAAGIEFIKGEFTKETLFNEVEYTNSSSLVNNVKQNINVVMKKTEAKNVQIVNWTKFTSTGAWTFDTVEEIAKDFERKNPGYSVIAGVNGDYFAYSPSRSINANINFNGDIIKAENHVKYFSVGFDNNNIVINKTMDFNNEYYLTVYEPNTNQILSVVKLTGLNTKVLLDNDTTVYYDSSVNLDSTKKYLVKTPIGLSFMDTHLYGKGLVTESTTNNIVVSNREFAVVTKNQSLQNLLDQKPIVRVQKLVSGNILNTNSVIGVDSQILKDGVVRGFNEIGGQSEDNNKSRHPRTSFGITEDGSIIIATVDGRQSTGAAGIYSSGVDLRDLATIMKGYGAVQAFNLDGGGSSQLVIKNPNGEIVTVNSPSEGPNFPLGHTYYKTSYRPVANALLFVVPDVNISANYNDMTSKSLRLDFQINSLPDITIEQSKLIINGQVQNLNSQNGQIHLNDLIENGINVVNFEFTYLKDGRRFTRVFASKIIDLSPESGNRERMAPKDFTVEFIEVENTNNLKIKVCYVDNDKAISKITVFLKNVNLNLSTTPDSENCQSALVLNAKANTIYDFGVKYNLIGNSEQIVLEHTYSHKYKPTFEEPIQTTTTQISTSSTNNPNHEKENSYNYYPLIWIIGGIVLLSTVGFICFILKGKYNNNGSE